MSELKLESSEQAKEYTIARLEEVRVFVASVEQTIQHLRQRYDESVQFDNSDITDEINNAIRLLTCELLTLSYEESQLHKITESKFF